ncbi:thioredoxin domain-containing protein [Thermostichus vulcanus]|uniref:Thioredoxin domain-containing protein n=1 Tax=Thermostichus vulcanus str. 'Rupite' TaxID=2813851 RepID=A0ABT0CDI2_THEVL|nr:thioredoxin domain-containing protein [Thermostichus vulcanus]MCJ2543846.1 thioredoxin domain-containing protein [Thermostichus vulcanus str. 'Rupite']
MTNRLATSPSLYLRKHAENPVDWWPWIPEALEKARAEDKPIFLSIGYSSCHWCTVMEGEAFSNPEIAAFLNEHFLPIKVDREERPDLDSIYMQTLQLMSGQGGWPLNVFLAPTDLVPFYAGTYFPVEPRFGRPGFLALLQRILQFYRQEKDKIEDMKGQILAALTTLSELVPEDTVPTDLLRSGIQKIQPLVSSTGAVQQFPMMPYAQLVLRSARFESADGIPGSTTALERAKERGMALVLGGIFDHVAGGFHRYTVDATWTVPHFEKMLYDNGQIVEFLSDLWAQGIQDAAIRRAVQLTIDWLAREMTAPAGYFYAAQDADSFAKPEDREPEEGEFYVWRWQELQELLGDEGFRALQQAFDLSPGGNFPDRPGYLVLQRKQGGELPAAVESALKTHLFRARYGNQDEREPFPPAVDAQSARLHPWPGRIPPVTDTKMIVSWNGLMISGLARAYQVFGTEEYLQMALRAAQFILSQQRHPETGSLLRVNYDGIAEVPAKSEDYALLIKALLDLHQACLPLVGTPSAEYWLEAAVNLQREMDSQLWDPVAGGYFVSDAQSAPELLVREKEFQDNATPAANGIAIANLARLSAVTGDPDYLERAEEGLKTFAHMMSTQPRSCPSLFTGLDWYANLVKVTLPAEHLSTFQQQSWPTTAFTLPTEADPLPEGAVGLVCWGSKCLAPAHSLEQVQSQISKGQNRA